MSTHVVDLLGRNLAVQGTLRALTLHEHLAVLQVGVLH